MLLYFVRHGTTDLVEKEINQPDDTPLNDKGRIQAHALANRFRSVRLDLLVSSPVVRALQTAKHFNTPFITSDLFSEIKNPTEMIGLGSHAPLSLEIKKQIADHSLDSSWHYSDEENFQDFYIRGMAALNFLTKQSVESIIVFSHANFITFLIGLMIFGPDMSVKIWLNLKNCFRLSNTGITVCNYDAAGWKLLNWNDTVHCP